MRLLTRSLAALLFVLVTALFLAVAAPRDAYALSCAPTTPELLVARADFVFTGTVHSVPTSWSREHPLAIMDVERYLKGSGPSRVTVDWLEAGWWGSWNKDNVGDSYLVFAKREGSAYVANLCNGTRPLAQNDQDGYLASIQSVTVPGLSPDPSLPIPPDSTTPNRTIWLISGVTLLVIAFSVTAAYLLRRRLAPTL